MWTASRALLEGLASGLGSNTITTHTSLKNAWLILFKSSISPTVNTVLADLDVADYEGYAHAHMTAWSVPFIGQGSKSVIEGVPTTWRPTGDDTVNTIFGHALMSDDSTTLLLTEPFNAPIPLPGPDYAFTDTPLVAMDSVWGWGNSNVAS